MQSQYPPFVGGAVTRLKAAERPLAFEPRCGTSLVVGGLLTATLGVAPIGAAVSDGIDGVCG